MGSSVGAVRVPGRGGGGRGRGERATGPLILRPLTVNPIDRRDAYRMVTRIAKAAGIPRHISPHSLRTPPSPTPTTPASRSATPRSSPATPDPRTTEHYDRARGYLDRHGVHFLTAYVAGV
jgi:hypothetical protein